MLNNLNQNSIPNDALINMHEKWQVIYWTKKWNISEEDLEQAFKYAKSSSAQKIHDAAVSLGLI